MADDVAMFRFENNAAENAAEISAALHETVSAIHEAAREAGGTQVPITLGNQIVEQMERAAREGSEAMRKALHPSNFTGAVPIEAVNDELAKNAGGAFQRAQREIDTMLSQLGPKAQKAMVDSGQLNRIMGDYADALVSEFHSAYDEFRARVTGGMDRLPPLPAREELAQHFQRNEGHPEDGGIGQQYVLQRAARSRIDRVFTTREEPTGVDDETETVHEINSEAYLAAEVKASAARIKIAAAKTKEELEVARRELAEAMTSMVGSESPYAKAFGYHLSPGTSIPTRPTAGGGYEEIVDPRKIAEASENMANLRHQVETTQRLLADGGPGRQIGKSPFFVDQSGGIDKFYEKAQQGGVQFLRLLNDTTTRTLALRDAQIALRKEQNAPEEKAKAEREAAESRARASQDAQQAADAKRTRGFVPGVVQGAFGSGFNGTGSLDQGAIMGNLGKTVGSAARYSLAYGGFYQFLNALKDGVSIFEDYQDSYTDFQVAMGSGNDVTQSTTNSLMELSRVVGENVGAAYDSAARGVRAFAADASEAQKQIAGFATASAAQKISVIANKPLADATGDVIAVGSAYGLSAPQADLLMPDAVSNAKRNLGGDPNQISQGLANFAVTAKLAGYNLQEAANVISLVQAKTDESGQTVATRLTRVVQILGGNTGKTLASDVNRSLGKEYVDTKADPKTQLEQFSKAYVAAGEKGLPDLQAHITSQLGGTANLKEILPILEGSGQARLAKALKDSLAGAGTDEYTRKINNLIGTLNKLKASVQNLVILSANADLFAPFAGAVGVLEPTAHLLERILQVYEKLEGFPGDIAKKVPGGHLLGPTATTLGEATLGVYAFQRIRRSTFAADVAEKNPGLLGSAARATGSNADAVLRAAAAEKLAAAEVKTAETLTAVQAAELELAAAAAAEAEAHAALTAVDADNAALRTTANAQWVAATEASSVAQTALADATAANAVAQAEQAAATEAAAVEAITLRSSFMTVISGLRKIAPFAAVLGGVLLAQDYYDKTQKQGASDTTRRDLLRTQGSDPTALANTRDSLDSLAVQQDKEQGYLHLIQGGRDSSITGEKSDEVNRMLIAVRREQDRLGVSSQKNATFGTAAARTVDSLSEAFKLLSEQGFSAKQALHQYYTALMTPPPDKPGTAEAPETSATLFTNQLNNSIQLQANDQLGPKSKGLFAMFDHSDDVRNSLSNYFDQGQADKVFAEGIKKAGHNLNKAQVRALAGKAFDEGFDPGKASNTQLASGIKGTYPLDIQGRTRDRALGDIDKFKKEVIDKYFMPQVKILQHQAGSLRPMSPAELTSLLTAQQGALSEADPTDPTATAKQARTNYLQLILRRNAQGTASQRVKTARGMVDEKLGQNPTNMLDSLLGGALRDVAGNTALKEFGQEQVAIRDARHVMRDKAMADAEDLRKAAESRVKDGDVSTLQKVRIKLATVSFGKAGADVALLETLFEALDRKTVKALLAVQDKAVKVAKLALDEQNRIDAEANDILGGPLGLGGDDSSTPFPQRTGGDDGGKARRNYERQRQKQKADKKAYDRSTITSKTADDSATEKILTAAQRRAMLAQANEDPDNSTEVARNTLAVAKANLAAISAKSGKKTEEYFNALKAVNEAENALAKNISSKIVSNANLAAARAGGGAMATAKAAIVAANYQLSLTSAGTPEHIDAETAVVNANLQKRQAEVAKVTSMASARAARIGGGIAGARAQITGAAASLRIQAKGTGEWWDALGNFYQGQAAMRDAVLQYRNNLDLLRGDSTDPVEQARDALRAARRQLANARSKDDKAAARVAVQDARNQYQQSKFEQRLQDVNTNESLDRITFAQKMSFLDHEHDRLTKIKHRTRQQQDQLNEVDQAIKDANGAMDSQFNLGDINTNGLVYQVRRFKAEAANQVSSANQFAPTATTNQQVTISINGADTAMVKRTIDSYLRIGGGQRRSLTRRKA